MCLLPLFFCVDCAVWHDSALCISCILLCFCSIAHRSAYRKKSEKRQMPAGPLAGVTVTHIYCTGLRSLLFWVLLVLYANLWGLGGKLTIFMIIKLQLKGRLSAISSCYCIHIIAPSRRCSSERELGCLYMLYCTLPLRRMLVICTLYCALVKCLNCGD